MSRTDYFALQFVESFPTPMQRGILYVSTEFSTAGHTCPCGCGHEVVTKLSPARWRLIFDGEVSLVPSIAATGMPCNSHYFITRGNVDWHSNLDAAQTARARTADRRSVDGARTPESVPATRWWMRVVRWVQKK